LDLDKIQREKKIWTPGILALPEPDSDGYIHVQEGSFAVWKDAGLLKNNMKIRFDGIKVNSQYGDSISISGNFPSVNLKDIVPNIFLNTPLILWATYHMSSQYSSQLDLDKLKIIEGGYFWMPRQ
jgi:hypothetical protein